MASQAAVWHLLGSLRTDFSKDPTVATRGPENGLGAEIAGKKKSRIPPAPEMSGHLQARAILRPLSPLAFTS